MSINHLIYRNLKKNLKNYYLYVFALIFSVALYFAFVTLQFDPAMDAAEGSIKGAAGIRTASIVLVGIVTIFLLYANTIFIKRRSKEIGLFQLIGMTKGKIFQILTLENLILYFGSLVIGTFIGFAASKFIMMILLNVIGIEQVATLRFSTEAMIQTLLVFTAIYFCIMIMNLLFIKRQSILSLFRVRSSTEARAKKMSILQMIIGVIGIGLIITGYFVSTKLFGGDFVTFPQLVIAMVSILASVIIGTYLFYKGSVSFIFHLIRKSKGGYLNLNDVLSLSSIMFRMKSNALLLTIITTVSALAIGLLCLSYISYYSAEKLAEQNVPAHFSIATTEEAETFKALLNKEDIAYEETNIDVVQVDLDVSQIMETDFSESEMVADPDKMLLPVVSEEAVEGIDVSSQELILTGYSGVLEQFISLKESGEVAFVTPNGEIKQNFLGLREGTILPYNFTGGGLPTAIVDSTIFEKLVQDMDPEIQNQPPIYIGIDIEDQSDLAQADEIFQSLELQDEGSNLSQLASLQNQKSTMGLVMFIVGFLGLAFLITSGCILYFKQMDESEEEKANYTILRKLGFTQGDLLRGIWRKQLFNFGIPLVIGLCHSYFAVKSGWFLFGTELWTPMIIVMIIYTALYSIFGILSVLYYKRVIRESL
ncbi:ABC transporter permease [Oceanobacillus profundus]|uniref:ABC transporter permease n=1 Tax=Oceanobacillus profundus TaxID=372463 RepID=A0A417YNM5_9BACI|nr:ABC transporter permease [Oceanobacillus profundus]PAE29089.1 bacitracin ABC transporter permease [Paenibacillus sp. 7884-2]RHW35173.1 ABC transporter permease [Oceanobacillus profundus]